MVKIGREIPDFEVGVFHNQEDKKIKLSDYRCKWMVLLFYPKDFTFVCPTELEDAASLYGDFQKLNAEVLSVSTDTVQVHKAWHDTSEAVGKVENFNRKINEIEQNIQIETQKVKPIRDSINSLFSSIFLLLTLFL